MNVALRAVHEALRGSGDPTAAWCVLIEGLAAANAASGVIDRQDIASVQSKTRIRGTPSQWLGDLRTLGVIDSSNHLDAKRADQVRVALELVADSFGPIGMPDSWAAVVTLPPDLEALLRPPPMRRTAGLLLELIDASQLSLVLTAPFIDVAAVSYLGAAITTAMVRGVDVRVITSEGNGARFASVASIGRHPLVGGMRVTEVSTELSSLGSHAKVVISDRERGYIGSANLTAAGLGRHVELGVVVAGPSVGDLHRILIALEHRGRTVLEVGYTGCTA